MTDLRTKPEIRFKGFTDAWEQRKLGQVADIIGGGTPSTSNEKYWGGDIDWYAPAEIGEQIFLTGSQKKITELGLQESSAKLLPIGTVLFTSRAGIGNTAILAKTGATNQGFQSIVPHKGGLDSYFIFSQTHKLKRYGEIVGAGSTFVEVSGKQMARMPILIPAMPEQRKIGDLFASLDHLITLHQREYEKTVNIKKAMLEKMFPKNGADIPEIRFKGFTDAWEQRKLGDIAEFFSGLTYSPHNVVGDGTLVLRSSNVKDGAIIDADNVYVTPECVNSDNVQFGDVIVVVRNGSRNLIGKHAQIKQFMSNTVIGAFMTGIRSDTPEFTNALLDTHQFDNEIKKNLGATINQITTGEFKKMTFYVPDREEQKTIGSFFANLDHLITLHQRELVKLQNIKKALLEKMFV
jgi:type I restriction enzyme S subunit